MKKSCYTVLLLCTVTFCFAQKETTYINQSVEVHLCNPFDTNELEENSPYTPWFNKPYDEFMLYYTTYSWSSELNDVGVNIYMGTWCGDSKKWVLSFLKAWDQLGLDRKKLSYTALYDNDERYKQGQMEKRKDCKYIVSLPLFLKEMKKRLYEL